MPAVPFSTSRHAAARVSCCGAADRCLATLPDEPALEAQIFEMFLHEWRLARGDVPLRSIAIVDRRPQEQFLHPEFLLARNLFAARGIGTEIVDPDDLEIRGEQLHARGVPVDLVYNRLTDFYFEATAMRCAPLICATSRSSRLIRAPMRCMRTRAIWR